MPNLNGFEKTGIYMRLSRDDDKSGESSSIENQRIILQRFVAEQGGRVVAEYVDDGWSGTNFHRPGVQQMLADAQSGRIDTVVVKDLSRFGRNYIQVGQYLDYVFPAQGTRFVAIADNVDTANMSSAAMDMMPVMNVFNEWHAASTSKKIRAALQARQRSGKFTNWRYPYGYKVGKDENRSAVVDENAAAVVRRIFRLRLQGASARSIAGILNEDKIPNPSTYYVKQDGSKISKDFSPFWSARTVMTILKNPVYIGTLIQHKTTGISYKNRKTVIIPEAQQLKRENVHQPIVSLTEWEKVQEINKSAPKGRRDKQSQVHALSGLLFCADCGKKLKLKKAKSEEGQLKSCFVCRTYADLGKKYCSSHRISENLLERVLLQDLKALLSEGQFDEEQAMRLFVRKLEKSRKNIGYFEQKQLSALKHRLFELQKLVQRAFEEQVLGSLPKSVCASLCEEYQKEKDVVEKQIGELELKLKNICCCQCNEQQYACRLKRHIEFCKLTRELSLQLIEAVTVGEKSEKDNSRVIHVYYKTKIPQTDNGQRE